jgi:hypothetical protein
MWDAAYYFSIQSHIPHVRNCKHALSIEFEILVHSMNAVRTCYIDTPTVRNQAYKYSETCLKRTWINTILSLAEIFHSPKDV